jgi:hypothetical protein
MPREHLTDKHKRLPNIRFHNAFDNVRIEVSSPPGVSKRIRRATDHSSLQWQLTHDKACHGGIDSPLNPDGVYLICISNTWNKEKQSNENESCAHLIHILYL